MSYNRHSNNEKLLNFILTDHFDRKLLVLTCMSNDSNHSCSLFCSSELSSDVI